MAQATLIINRVLPILLLISLGYWIRKREFLTESTIDELRKVVVNIALPAVLFISFLDIEMRVTYFVTFILLYALCIALFAFGHFLKRLLKIDHPYFPFLITGFEYGMMGVSLFGSAYGLEKIGYIAVMDLGHEVFIWSVFLAFLLMRRDGIQKPGELAGSFVQSPVVISIIAGIGLNLLGLRTFLYERPITGGLIATLDFLGGLIVPVILIIVGYGIRLDQKRVREALPVVAIRLVVLLPLTFLLNIWLIRGVLNMEFPFEAALFTLLMMPPPFIIPLYMPGGMPEERAYVNNVLMLYTLVSLVIFAVYFILNPVLG
jgi:predicted permease